MAHPTFIDRIKPFAIRPFTAALTGRGLPTIGPILKAALELSLRNMQNNKKLRGVTGRTGVWPVHYRVYVSGFPPPVLLSSLQAALGAFLDGYSSAVSPAHPVQIRIIRLSWATLGKLSSHLRKFCFIPVKIKKKKNNQLGKPPKIFKMATRGTVKASANFNASADAEVLHKAMKGLGKILILRSNLQQTGECFMEGPPPSAPV
ncbi:hypothetical protein CCH79_00013894 [Gambusia affinis]|uniref:Uncharacterized protein n=1 Tax=Gambusia affinis TaxID=33528 RepID=A0A315VWF1_GAMAF|nr:hypothetical protein CCH79_00013894 [Gambusia affinis]